MPDSSFFTDPAILSLLSAAAVLLLAQVYTKSVLHRQPLPRMKTWRVFRNGEPNEALVLQDTGDETAKSLPQPKGADVLIRVSHAALNPADLMFMRSIPTWLPFRRHPIPGIDFAGEIVALGPKAATWPAHAADPLTVGTRVAGCLSVRLVTLGQGTLVEYLTVPADLVARQLDVSFGSGGSSADMGAPSAGVLGCAGQTAHLAAADPCAEAAFALPTPPRVLINGASGSVGSLLVQICKARGAHVTGICSGKNEAFVHGLGADDVVDYTQHDPHPTLPDHLAATPAYTGSNAFDLIFDCVGDPLLFFRSPAYLKPHGALLNIVGGGPMMLLRTTLNQLLPSFLGGTPRTYKLLALGPSGEQARAVRKWATGAKPLIKEMPIDSVFSMAEVKKAYARQATKRARGKIIVQVQADERASK
ncbi:MAG: zinc ion binding [Sporothrix thermara]